MATTTQNRGAKPASVNGGFNSEALGLIETKGLTLVGVTLSNLEHYDAQLLLPVERRRAGALDAALDDVRERFGSDAIVRAVLLGRDRGLEIPLLPDLE